MSSVSNFEKLVDVVEHQPKIGRFESKFETFFSNFESLCTETVSGNHPMSLPKYDQAQKSLIMKKFSTLYVKKEAISLLEKIQICVAKAIFPATFLESLMDEQSVCRRSHYLLDTYHVTSPIYIVLSMKFEPIQFIYTYH